MAASILSFSEGSTLSADSSKVFLHPCMRVSAAFLACTSSSNFLSSSAFASASCTIFSISSSERPLDAWIVIDCSLFVALSLADTFKIPFASMSKETSICGIPLGAAGIPSKLNKPNCLLSLACFLSPCTTFTVTAV